MQIVLMSENKQCILGLGYILTDSGVNFSHEKINYSVEFIYGNTAVRCSKILLSIRVDKWGYKEYILRLSCTDGIKKVYDIVYGFDEINLVNCKSIELVAYINSGIYELKSNLVTVKRGGFDRSWSNEFTQVGDVAGLLKCFDCIRIEYIISDGKLTARIKDGYLVIEDGIFSDNYRKYLKTPVLYSCEYNGYMYYMADFDFDSRDITSEGGFDCRIIVKDERIVYSLEDNVTILNKRLV